ncbi:DUF221-domain-containing protein [Westerdykella ornata]|uniref:DUF221-domain-containing protein n=1 Tax=Westerdykella ornata TaxID=318751 RepID=A0A6A6JEU4_WESOR|nr:DUF221-domain-containing protein [Westerdykella ornata]KAF2274156.1 DUF221-domain-containing protein [Westerdykella ornata]
MARQRLPRDATGDKFMQLMSDPFASGVTSDSILIAVFTALGVSAAVFVVFLLVRPFNSTVYAPRLRHADEKHKPPPLGKGLFAWYNPVFRYNEDQYVETIGLDAAVFLRFARMCRNLFAVLAIVGCAIIIPINVINAKAFQKKLASDGVGRNNDAIFLMSPQSLFGGIVWAFVAVAYVFTAIICFFLWWNYRAVHRLRRRYLESAEYQNSLHARTLMVTDIPRNLRSDHGIVEITDAVRTTNEVPRASIGRNVKDIPDLIEQHEEAVMALEKVLAKYLKNPNQLPAQRPLCKPSRRDTEFAMKGEKVDAIDYLTARIERLEAKIKEARETVDKRDAMPYGFASYEAIDSAHSVAYAARSKHPHGTTIGLAPRPNDIIWKNLPLDPKTRRWRRFINNLWISLLTVLYFIPNALIAVFLSKLSNLANLWEGFNTQMRENPKFWAVVQGILAPALTSLFYYFLPIIFRRLSMKAGDLTKTSRERHVIHQLYSFFVFNNLFVFSLFAAVFRFVTIVVAQARADGGSFLNTVRTYDYFEVVMVSLSDVSPFWITWLVQRNLGAAIDLAQVVNLAWGSFSRKFLNPTPRELIKRTAPPPFDYASYYNYFLFYSTVALCFAALQPVTLVVTAFYFAMDASMKKYLLLYVFCTKNESGGLYWRVIFNRFLVGTFLANLIIACMCGARGFEQKWYMLAAMIPLVLGLIAFKLYCKRAFDTEMKYYTKGSLGKGAEAPAPIDKESRKRDRVAVRFGNPALYQKLTVPMVHKKSQHLLAEIYKGRLDGDLGTTAGFSDMYSMKRMSKETPGKAASAGPFEFVSEADMDFENFKNRPEFSNEHGGEGSVYGHVSRPGTPAGSERGRSSSRGSERTYAGDEMGVTYPTGYHNTPSNLREYSPSPERGGFGRMDSNQSNPSDPYQVRDHTALLDGAAPMGHMTPTQSYTPYSPEREGGSDYFRPVR